MNIRAHAFNRNEVIAIFVDIHPSMLEEDLALPIPIHAHANPRLATASPSPPEPVPAAAVTANGNNSGVEGDEASRYTPPTTRVEVVLEALRSFVAQKERATARAERVHFALYAVLVDAVTELLPPTPGGSAVLEAAMRRYCGRSGVAKFNELLASVLTSPADRRTTGFDALSGVHTEVSAVYPFAAVQAVLQGIDYAMAAGVSGDVGGAGTSLSPHDTTPSKTVTTAGNPRQAHGGDPLPTRREGGADGSSAFIGTGLQAATAHRFVQGIALVSRPTQGPMSSSSHVTGKGTDSTRAAPSGVLATSNHNSSGQSEVWLDVITLSSPGLVAKSCIAQETLDIPFHVMEPSAFTSIAHRGLALGPTLTNLLATHRRATEAGSAASSASSPAPVFVVELSPSAAAVTAAAVGAQTGHGNVASKLAPSLPSSSSNTPTKDVARAHGLKATPVAAAEAAVAGKGASSTISAEQGHTMATTLPALRRNLPPQHLTVPSLTGPLHGHTSSAPALGSDRRNSALAPVGTKAPAAAAEPSSPITTTTTATPEGPQGSFVRGTVVAASPNSFGSSDGGRESITRGRPVGYSHGKRSSLPSSIAGAASITAIEMSGRRPGGVEVSGISTATGALASPGTAPLMFVSRRSPQHPSTITGKLQALQLRSGLRGESPYGAAALTSNASNRAVDGVGDGSNTSGSTTPGILPQPQWSVYPSEMITRSAGGGTSSGVGVASSSPAGITSLRGRADSTGTGLRRHQQQLRQDRERQKRAGRGSSQDPPSSPAVDGQSGGSGV